MNPPASGGRRILVAHPRPELYGSDRVLLESVDALVEDGWEVVVTLPADGPLVEHLERRGARVELCPSPVLTKAALRPLGFARLVGEGLRGTVAGLRLIRRARVDAVYVNTVTVPLWFVLARAARRPVLAHVHEAEGSASALVRRVLAAPLLLATRIVVNSRFSREVLLASIPALGRRASVLDNAVPGPPAAPQVPRERLDGGVRLLYMGRLSPRKGTDVAVEALRLLAERDVDARLDLVGAVFTGYEWYERELTELAASSGAGERVVLHGFQPEVWSHLASADVVLVPSRTDEPFGNTAVEAVLAARPVVVSDTSGLREAAQGYGCARYVAPGDAAALADGIEDVLAHWPRYRASAVGDAAAAGARHAPARYREQVAREVSALVGELA